jgi:hypothetical protein
MKTTISLAAAGRACAVAAALCAAVACGDGPGSLVLSGCQVVTEIPQGGWRGDPYELHPFFTSIRNDQFTIPACPVSILHPNESVHASGVLWSNQVFNPQTGYVTDQERARLRMMNSQGRVLREDVQPFFAGYGNIDYKEIELHVQYPAISGHQSFAEKDLMEVTITDYCCPLPQFRGEVEVQVNYAQDQSAARVTAVGDEIPLQNSSATYGAISPSAGRPHTFNWYRNGAWVGSGPSYTAAAGSADFDLRVDMSDGYGRTASNTLHVDVDGVRVASFTGPAEVWASAGGGTWTATARGGSGPYTFNWYVDNRWVGSGSSWTGYRVGQEGWFNLRVDVANANGATHSQGMDILQMGTGSGGCDPQPGQDACAVNP